MNKEQLVKALEQATFYGTWEEACEAQRQLDEFVKEQENAGTRSNRIA